MLTAWQALHHPHVCHVAAEKLEQAEGQLSHAGRTGQFGGMERKATANDSPLLKICRDSSKMSVEQVKGITAQVRAPQAASGQHSYIFCGV